MYDTTSGDFLSVAGPVVATTGDSFTDHFVSVPQRISGSTADATAVQELEHQFPTGSCPGTTGTRPVVLATHKSYPDALSSAYLASSLGTGTLLTASTSLSAATLGALKQEGITNVVVVGGSLAVTATVVNQLEATPAYSCGGGNKLGKNLTVRRIAGPTAYDTALDIATAPTKTYVGKVDLAGAYGVNTQGDAGIYNTTKGNASPAALSPTAVPTAILATTHTFQDAMSASTVAYADHLPILLTTTSKLSSQVSSAISQLGIQQVIVMGGPFAVSDAVVTALEGEHVSVLRIAGTDYTDTAVELALCELGPATGHVGLGWPSTGGVFVARGSGFTDGLAGAVVTAGGPAGASPSPLLLTENATTPGTYLLGFLAVAGTGGVATKPLTHLVVLGGPLAVSEHSANLMEVALDL
jgi:putative cell wall-binding protein